MTEAPDYHKLEANLDIRVKLRSLGDSAVGKSKFLLIKMNSVTFMEVVQFIAAIFIIFGGIFPYIPQYIEIQRSESAEGFSTFVCLALLLANILRVFFWFGRPFELPLLFQSIVMIITMLIMMKLCVSVKSVKIIPSKESHFSDFDQDHFWKWSDFLSYLQFIAVFSAIVAMVTYALYQNFIYVELLGFLSVFVEAMLGTPQFYKNYQKKSTVGMSLAMVGMWTSGDIFKTSYFILRRSPLQFTICGILQVSIDIALFCQYLYYDRFHNSMVSEMAT